MLDAPKPQEFGVIIRRRKGRSSIPPNLLHDCVIPKPGVLQPGEGSPSLRCAATWNPSLRL